MLLRRILMTVVCLVLPAAVLAGEEPAPVPDLIQVLELDAPREEVWKAFTTDELAMRWMAPVVEFDLRPHGTMKTNYSKEAGIGGPGTIVHRVLALDVPTLVVMKTEAPEGNPFKDVLKDVTGSWRFEAVAPDRTRITLGMHNWPAGTEAKGVRAFFERANPTVLAKLKTLFPDRPSGAEAMKRLRALVGSWDGSIQAGKRTLLARREIRAGPGGKGVIGSTSFGPAQARRLHKHEQVWLDEDGVCRFRMLGDRGDSVSGTLRCGGDEDVLWEFRERGKAVRLRFGARGEDACRFSVSVREGDGDYVEQFHVDYRRAQDGEAPARPQSPDK